MDAFDVEDPIVRDRISFELLTEVMGTAYHEELERYVYFLDYPPYLNRYLWQEL
jgi:hypothetical protein